MNRVYLDASALVKLTVAEDGSEAVLGLVDAASDVITSVLALVEVRRAVLRVDPGADPWAVLGRCTIIDLDPETIEAAAALAPADLRSLDAIHVASALAIASDLDAFVTFDHRQAAAALAVGLPVEVPACRRWIREGKLRASKVGTQHVIEERDLTEFESDDDEMMPLPPEWRRTAAGAPMPNVVAALRRARAGR